MHNKYLINKQEDAKQSNEKVTVKKKNDKNNLHFSLLMLS